MTMPFIYGDHDIAIHVGVDSSSATITSVSSGQKVAQATFPTTSVEGALRFAKDMIDEGRVKSAAVSVGDRVNASHYVPELADDVIDPGVVEAVNGHIVTVRFDEGGVEDIHELHVWTEDGKLAQLVFPTATARFKVISGGESDFNNAMRILGDVGFHIDYDDDAIIATVQKSYDDTLALIRRAWPALMAEGIELEGDIEVIHLAQSKSTRVGQTVVMHTDMNVEDWVLLEDGVGVIIDVAGKPSYVTAEIVYPYELDLMSIHGSYPVFKNYQEAVDAFDSRKVGQVEHDCYVDIVDMNGATITTITAEDPAGALEIASDIDTWGFPLIGFIMIWDNGEDIYTFYERQEAVDASAGHSAKVSQVVRSVQEWLSENGYQTSSLELLEEDAGVGTQPYPDYHMSRTPWTRMYKGVVNGDTYIFTIDGYTEQDMDLGVVDMPQSITEVYDSTLGDVIAKSAQSEGARRLRNTSTDEEVVIEWDDGSTTLSTESEYEGRMFSDYGDGRYYEYLDDGTLGDDIWEIVAEKSAQSQSYRFHHDPTFDSLPNRGNASRYDGQSGIVVDGIYSYPSVDSASTESVPVRFDDGTLIYADVTELDGFRTAQSFDIPRIIDEARRAGIAAATEQNDKLKGAGPAWEVFDADLAGNRIPGGNTYTMNDVCGFAWIHVPNGRDKLVQAMRRLNGETLATGETGWSNADKDFNDNLGYSAQKAYGMTGYDINIGGMTRHLGPDSQYMSVNGAAARAAMGVLQRYGLGDARVMTRMD